MTHSSIYSQSQKMEYSGINQPKRVQALYAKNYKMLVKEKKSEINGETYHVMDRKTQHRKGINPHPLICRFNAILPKVPARFLFVDIDNLTLKFTRKGPGPRIAKTLKQEKQVGKITLFDVQSCSIAAATRIVGHLWRTETQMAGME